MRATRRGSQQRSRSTEAQERPRRGPSPRKDSGPQDRGGQPPADNLPASSEVLVDDSAPSVEATLRRSRHLRLPLISGLRERGASIEGSCIGKARKGSLCLPQTRLRTSSLVRSRTCSTLLHERMIEPLREPVIVGGGADAPWRSSPAGSEAGPSAARVAVRTFTCSRRPSSGRRTEVRM